MQRRTFFGLMGAGAVTAALPLPGLLRSNRTDTSRRADVTRAESGRGRTPSLDFLLAPLVGRPLPGGFRVSSASEIDRGSVAITLTRQDGAQAQVQVFRRSAISSGLSTTRLLDLRWMNGGDGERVTQESAGIAIMSLAARLRRIESATLRDGLAANHRAALRALSTHEERNARHGGFFAAQPVTEPA